MRKHILLLSLPLLLTGCQSDSPVTDLLEGRKVEYTGEDSQRSQDLQYPPDLIAGDIGIAGTVSLSEYTIQSVPTYDEEEQEVVEESSSVKVLYQRDGRLRWVRVGLPADELWARVRGFWADNLGLQLGEEKPRLGIMETEWLQLRERLQGPGFLRGYLDNFLNRLSDSGHRDKFVTRLERNENNGTDVYISHRHAVAAFDNDGGFSGFETAENNVELEVEMLRRLMLYLAARELEDDNADINEQLADAEEAGENSEYEHDGAQLLVKKPFFDSWRAVQIGLDRGGFTITDRDLQERIIYIRHSGGPESDKIFGKAETRFFNRLFGDEKPVLRDIELHFLEEGEQTVVTVKEAAEDDALTELQQSVVLELLYTSLP